MRDIGRQKCGIVSFTLEGCDPFEVKTRLSAQAINLSVSRPSSTLLDATARHLPPVLRASVHYYNDETEIARLIEALSAIAQGGT